MKMSLPCRLSGLLSNQAMLAFVVLFPAFVLCDECSPSDLFPCSHSIFGNIVLMAMYGFVLAVGAKIISDGSEMLLLIMNPGFIGGFVLPVLGGLPDAAIIVVSCLGPKDQAQENISVGVGTLAGSTIMLLTIALGASLWVARCDITADGKGVIEGQLTNTRDILNTGMSVGKDVRVGAAIMIGLSFLYFVIQGVAFVYVADPDSDTAKTHEKNFALATFVLCMVAFLCYGTYQVMSTDSQEDRIKIAKEEAKKKAILEKWDELMDAVLASRHMKETQSDAENQRLLTGSTNSSGSVGNAPASSAASSNASVSKFAKRWKHKAVDSKKEQIQKALVADVDSLERQPAFSHQGNGKSPVVEVAAEEEEENEYAHLTKAQIAVRAAGMLIFGVGVVAFFSDPMVDCISEFGTLINVPAFYVSFIITPFCSNASELISSLIFAARKTEANATITFSQLFGACCINATVSLGCLTGLIYFRDLTWEFSAEVLAILFVVLSVGIFAMRCRVYRTWHIIPIGFLYIASLALVAFLENVVHWK
eukprot:ANDGO_08530.mRNA.1 hypothetical protein DICPUDRAFT_153287